MCSILVTETFPFSNLVTVLLCNYFNLENFSRFFPILKQNEYDPCIMSMLFNIMTLFFEIFYFLILVFRN